MFGATSWLFKRYFATHKILLLSLVLLGPFIQVGHSDHKIFYAIQNLFSLMIDTVLCSESFNSASAQKVYESCSLYIIMSHYWQMYNAAIINCLVYFLVCDIASCLLSLYHPVHRKVAHRRQSLFEMWIHSSEVSVTPILLRLWSACQLVTVTSALLKITFSYCDTEVAKQH